MNNKKYNMNFHESFKPELDNICRLLQISEKENLSKEEIFDLTGIPTGKDSGKVVPTILYANYMNLISYEKEGGKFNIELTSLGQLILDEDPYIQEDITKILLNYFLTSKNYGAKLWFIIVRKIPSIYGVSVKLEDINRYINSEFNLKKNIKLAPFLGTYNSGSDFEYLNLMSIDNDKIEFNQNYINRENIYAYAYTLLLELKLLDSNRIEFDENEIFEDIMWHRGLGMNKEEAFNVLLLLEEENIIKINKQLSPITIIMKTSEENLRSKVYSLLI